MMKLKFHSYTYVRTYCTYVQYNVDVTQTTVVDKLLYVLYSNYTFNTVHVYVRTVQYTCPYVVSTYSTVLYRQYVVRTSWERTSRTAMNCHFNVSSHVHHR